VAGDSKGARNRTSNRSETARRHHDGVTLCDATRMWMTPTARDHKDGATSLANTPVNGLLGRQVLTMPTAGSDISAQRRTLNPAFVEALMGWPTGWTGFDSAATEWCRWLRRMRSELSRLSCSPTDDDTIAGAGHGA
jgi:DNA (cytosine-5)-methyltransferase 1